jgi:oligosaccharyltransferase complex subunit gamma
MRWSLLVLAGLVTASDRLSKLEKLSKASGLVKLDSRLYEEFTQGSRDYSLTVLLTALSPQFKCTPCQQFQPEHRAVAQQWQRKARQPLHKHFFAVLDFPDGQDTFRKVRCVL